MNAINKSYSNFLNDRDKPVAEKFSGLYRALVVETNDPLNMRRVRIKCPELHDADIADSDCPWAVVSNDLNSSHFGNYSSLCRNDYVFVEFEKGHPYAPVVVGKAPPTRRQLYPLSSVYTESPVPVDSVGKVINNRPNDFNTKYLPLDRRPMSSGTIDRYGNIDIQSSVGFFPIEHAKKPASPGHDAIQTVDFAQASAVPKVNNPDVKHSTRISKYGNILTMGDQGYYWKLDGELGEFSGDLVDDRKFEEKRWEYLQRLINEDNVQNTDQRKLKLLTRYGHLLEMRDTGWAQPGPKKSKSRKGEYLDDQRYLSNNTTLDMRWIKLRTKGGHLFQAIDIGADPEEDEFIKRRLIDEVGFKTELENEYWMNRDARQMRLITRYGHKLVLSDEGSDTKDARGKESPHGKGILLKTRRSPGYNATGNQRGFHFEMNDTDDIDHMLAASPGGVMFEINDKHEYVGLFSRLDKFTPEWKNVKDNEFITSEVTDRNVLKSTHHLFIDHQNEFISLKSRGGGGDKPIITKTQSTATFQQGLEIRDGGNIGPWVELVDTEHRGVWFSKQQSLSILRGKTGSGISVCLDDANGNIVINNDNGSTFLKSGNSINIVSNVSVTISAPEVKVLASKTLHLQGGGGVMTINSDSIRHNVPLVQSAVPPDFNKVTVPVYPLIEPTDRGMRR